MFTRIFLVNARTKLNRVEILLPKSQLANSNSRLFCTRLAQNNSQSRSAPNSSNSKTLLSSHKNLFFNSVKYKSTNPFTKNNFISITWKSVIVVLLFGGALYLFMVKMRIEKEESLKRKRKEAIGKMAIGGPFELVDHTGKLRKSSDFFGQWLLIYFGFTHCPDICPEEIEKMIKVTNLVEKVDIKNTKIQPLFLTVDPDRDDVKTVAKYVKDYSSKLIGLTGSKEQVEKVTRAYRVYFSAGPKDEDNDYIVDHTVIIYLIDPEGNFVDYFGQNKTAEEIASATAIHMSTFKPSDKKSS